MILSTPKNRKFKETAAVPVFNAHLRLGFLSNGNTTPGRELMVTIPAMTNSWSSYFEEVIAAECAMYSGPKRYIPMASKPRENRKKTLSIGLWAILCKSSDTLMLSIIAHDRPVLFQDLLSGYGVAFITMIVDVISHRSHAACPCHNDYETSGLLLLRLTLGAYQYLGAL